MNNTAVKQKEKNLFIINLVEFFENTSFFLPSEALTDRYVRRLSALDSRGYSKDRKRLSLQQKFLGQQLYLYLATLSKTPSGMEGESLDLTEELSDWFCKSIGLEVSSDDREIIKGLITEFDNWLKANDNFLTGWGSIHSAGENHVVLKRHGQDRK